jgi:hypothetical protein
MKHRFQCDSDVLRQGGNKIQILLQVAHNISLFTVWPDRAAARPIIT